MQNGRIIAVGTSVVRTLEDAAGLDGSVRAGEGVATRRIGSGSRLRVVDAMLSGTHEPGTSHHELLHAFVDDETLARIDWELNLRGYRTHEFGDSVFVERIERPFVRAGLTFGAAQSRESSSDPQHRRMRELEDQPVRKEASGLSCSFASIRT